jgi:hypothetical protein
MNWLQGPIISSGIWSFRNGNILQITLPPSTFIVTRRIARLTPQPLRYLQATPLWYQRFFTVLTDSLSSFADMPLSSSLLNGILTSPFTRHSTEQLLVKLRITLSLWGCSYVIERFALLFIVLGMSVNITCWDDESLSYPCWLLHISHVSLWYDNWNSQMYTNISAATVDCKLSHPCSKTYLGTARHSAKS